MTYHMIVRARHDADAVAVRVVRQAPQVGDDPLRLRHVQLAVGMHEVVLGVDIPEDDAGHGGESLRGYRSVSTGGRIRKAWTHRRTAVNRRSERVPVLQPETYCNLITTVVARAPLAVRPHLEREVLALGGGEADLQKERRFAGQREYLGQAVRPRLGDQRREQRAADARPLPVLAHGEGGELRQVA